ncbi:MAG: site-2 protease family protein, partial [Lachnospiraceae bacterium]|nr:site-2 protease family protein [Lachnospiraceae bacterium]
MRSYSFRSRILPPIRQYCRTESPLKDLSGPVGIVSMINDVGETSESRADALINIFYFIAFISVNLAVMNLLP